MWFIFSLLCPYPFIPIAARWLGIMVPEFGVVFSEARLIARIGRLREDTDRLEGEVVSLPQEVKILQPIISYSPSQTSSYVTLSKR